MKVGFVFPLAHNRSDHLQFNHILSLEQVDNLEIQCYSGFTNDIEQDLYVERDQDIWEMIRQVREKGQKIAYDDDCDWIIHHDYGELFHDDYLVRLSETLNSNMSHHYADFSYFTRFNKYQVVSPVYRMNQMNDYQIDDRPFLVDNDFWEKVWQQVNNTNHINRYFQVRRGSSWIWHRKILEFLNFEIKPQSEEIRRHDSHWREYLFDKGFKCVLDTKLRKIDNTDEKAIQYYNN